MKQDVWKYQNVCSFDQTLNKEQNINRDCILSFVSKDTQNIVFVCLFDGVLHHIQQYFSYIVAVSFIGGGTGRPWEKHRPVESHWQTLSHNVVHLALTEIWTHNISGDT